MYLAIRLQTLRFSHVRPAICILSTVQARRISRFLVCSLGAGTVIGYFSLTHSCLASESSIPLGKSTTSSISLNAAGEMISKVAVAMVKTQEDVVRELDRLEGDSVKLVKNLTAEQEGGGSSTCVIQDGNVFEKACVNVAVTSGTLSGDALERVQCHLQTRIIEPVQYSSAVITSAIHPRNPNIPSLHFSYGYFEVKDSSGVVQSWLDGSCDITPYILHEDDIHHFHQTLKRTCDQYCKSYYHTFKKQCDEYFFIKHRQEHRGVGGILFKGLSSTSQEDLYAFVSGCLLAVLPSYMPVVEKNMDRGYSYCDRDWQLARQGRYVEFDLLYGTGAEVGQTKDNFRGDLMLPLNARWWYDRKLQEGSRERKLLEVLRAPKEWISMQEVIV